MDRPVLLCYDGSEGSKAALSVAVELVMHPADAVVLVVFAAGALLIAIQGIYGTLAYLVEQRRREIGIRVAIGATPRAVRRTVVARGMRATGIGLAVGALVAVAAGRVVGGWVHRKRLQKTLNARMSCGYGRALVILLMRVKTDTMGLP